MSLQQRFSVLFLLVASTSLLAIGCTGGTNSKAPTAAISTSDHKPAEATPTQNPSTATEDAAEHGHKAGAHGGIMVSLGRDSYHAEAVFEKGGVLRLYMLGNDESRVIDVEKQTLKGFVRIEGDAETQPFVLEAQPQEGDAEGRTSQFLARLPEGLAGKSLEVTIPNIVIAGERFRLGFKSVSEPHAGDSMPAKASSTEEQQLYLTAGGLYTEDDIAANGRTTAAAKFKGFKAQHDAKPASGDKICPISMTKANPQFTWIVGGKPYEFCCPPCVDEFMRTAKTKPAEIKLPTDYVQP